MCRAAIVRHSDNLSVKSPVVRSFSLPNGSKITSLRESTLRGGLKAASLALKTERALNQTSRVHWTLLDPEATDEEMLRMDDEGYVEVSAERAAGRRWAGGPMAACLGESPPTLSYDKIQAARIEGALFDFLSRNYVQTANRRQRRWGDVYMKAETHDLAHAVAKFIMLNRERLLDGA